MQLTQRQALILKAVVDLHHATGRPVGSRALVDHGIAASSSTIRYELGRLEELGLLEHPHTSAGRVPTDEGYRLYVDRLMDAAPAERAGSELETTFVDAGTRIEDALRETTRLLADATGLLAVVTAPRASGAVIRHVELLQLQPTRLVVVVITAAGDVARYVSSTRHPVDPGLVDWARQYLDEQVAGLTIGEHRLRQRLTRPDLAPLERSILELIAPAFDEFGDDARQELHVGGQPHLLAGHGTDVERVAQLVAMLDERRRLLEALRPMVDRGVGASRTGATRTVAVRIGGENAMPELQRLSVVGAAYGDGVRPLGMVGLIGPRAMDYRLATHVVTAAADGLSDVASELYGTR